jgi:hypothetical protein
MLSFSALVTGLLSAKSSYHVKKSPKWFKDKLQNLNAREYFGDITEEVPTFFHRQNKDGKTVNAFEEDWFEIRCKHPGRILTNEFKRDNFLSCRGSVSSLKKFHQ